MSKKQRYIYMMVTSDVYELPIVIGDSAVDLAKKIGVSPGTVKNSIKRRETGTGWSRYVRIPCPVDDE